MSMDTQFSRAGNGMPVHAERPGADRIDSFVRLIWQRGIPLRFAGERKLSILSSLMSMMGSSASSGLR